MSLTGAYALPLLGGGLIGVAASVLLLVHGRVAGIAGLFGGLFLPGHDARGLRLWFVLGMLGAGVVLCRVYPAAFPLANTLTKSALPMLALAGLLVGFGTRLGGGCTSGHGVCGLSRFSVRSLVATVTFMGVAMLTVFVVRHVLGLAGAAQ